MPALGLGLPLIAALSDAFELRGSAGQGTEVRMTFNFARDGDPADENPVQGTVGNDGRWDPDKRREPSTRLAALARAARSPTLVREGLCSPRVSTSPPSLSPGPAGR